MTVTSIAERFALGGVVVDAAPFAGGHINDSWLVTCSGGKRYLVQRVNDHVFPHPHDVIENVVHVTAHLARELQRAGVRDVARRTLTIVPTRKGAAYFEDDEEQCWRTYVFIERTCSFEFARDTGQATRAGRAFGTFQRLMASYDGPPLHETIEGFHDTPRRLTTLEAAVEEDAVERVAEAKSEIEAIERYRRLADVLMQPLRAGEVTERVVHNDAKLSNVLFDERTNEPLCVVDLDTVMDGLPLYDFGDMARSMAVRVPEDAEGVERLEVDRELFGALAKGYLEGTAGLLNPTERDLMVPAAQVLALEQAVRFLTDYLEGDPYYRISRPQQNLDRCRVQLALLDALIREEAELRQILHIM